MCDYSSNPSSDFALLESVRRHLFDDSDSRRFDAPLYCRSNSFSSLFETGGELPLKEDDSDDMVIYGFLRDAAIGGWTPTLAPLFSETASYEAVGERMSTFHCDPNEVIVLLRILGFHPQEIECATKFLFTRLFELCSVNMGTSLPITI
ncbi:unnamed protein product, partial [Vitis vinifera]